MARPTPQSKFLVELALWVRTGVRFPQAPAVLMAAQPWSNYALVAQAGKPEIHVLDRKRGTVARKLEPVRSIRNATDLGHFLFSNDGMLVAAYDLRAHTFHAWSMNDGDLLHNSEGQGQIPPAIAFMTGGRLAICDGPNLNIHQLKGELLYEVPVSADLRSLTIFAPLSPQPVCLVVGVFRKGLGGLAYQCFRVEDGRIVKRQEGPDRVRPKDANTKRFLSLHELTNIPGSTARILVVTEEERLETKAHGTDWEYDNRYKTRILAIDPQTARFHQGELEIGGRHCLESDRGELFLIDEMGRRRRVCGFPLRLEKADWRLPG